MNTPIMSCNSNSPLNDLAFVFFEVKHICGPVFYLGIAYTWCLSSTIFLACVALSILIKPYLPFLRTSAMLKHVIAIGLTSVRPSVRHTLAPYQNG